MTAGFFRSLDVGSLAESLLSRTYTLMSPAPKQTQSTHSALNQLHDNSDSSYVPVKTRQNGDVRSHKQPDGKRRKLIDRLEGNAETHDVPREKVVKKRKLSSGHAKVISSEHANEQVNGKGKATHTTSTSRSRGHSLTEEIETLSTTTLKTSLANELLKPTLGPGQTRPTEPKKNEKRSLRSHDGGSRSKSELSLYFPNWDSFVNNEQTEQDPLLPETRLYITDEPTKASSSSHPFITDDTPFHNDLVPTPVIDSPTTATARKPPNLTIRRIVLPLPPKRPWHNPLPDDMYEKLHGKSERREKQLRNIEKERAQHEKFQLECLYDSLRGPDWLKVMGISGIVESDRKQWEGKREWAIREVGALLRKFKAWKEEEKRLKDEAMEMEDESEDRTEMESEEEEESESESDAPPPKRRAPKPKPKDEEPKPSPRIRFKTQPSQNIPDTSHSHAHPPISTKKSFLLPVQPERSGPFTSFFASAHQRAQALNPDHRGRTVLAFGHPVPEMEDREFSLPREYTTEEARRERARQRRRLKRTGKDPT